MYARVRVMTHRNAREEEEGERRKRAGRYARDLITVGVAIEIVVAGFLKMSEARVMRRDSLVGGFVKV